MKQIPDSGVGGEVITNANLDGSTGLGDLAVYCYRYDGSSGLVWAYYGGIWGGFSITTGTVTLSASNTNYIVVAVATGVLSVSTSASNWNNATDYVRVYKIVTGASSVNDGGVESHRVGPGGVLGAAGATGGGGGTELKNLTFTSDTGSTADSDPGNGLFKWNNATQGSATVLFFDNLTEDGVSMTTFFAALGASGTIYMQQGDDASKWQLWRWSSLPVAGSGYYKFTVTLLALNGSMADAKTVYCDFSGAPTSRIGLSFEKEFALSDLATAIVTGTTKGYWRPAFAATGVSFRASLRVASSSGDPAVDMNKNGSSMCSTTLTIDATETTSVTAATPVAMSTTTFAVDDLIAWDIDTAGTGAMGLIVTVTGLYAS